MIKLKTIQELKLQVEQSKTILPSKLYLDALKLLDTLAEVIINHQKDEKLNNISLLSPQEYNILSLLAKGISRKDIPQQLSITYGTFKLHLSNIYKKLSVSNQLEAVDLFNRHVESLSKIDASIS